MSGKVTYYGYFGRAQNVRDVKADGPSVGSMVAAIERLQSRAERDASRARASHSSCVQARVAAVASFGANEAPEAEQ